MISNKRLCWILAFQILFGVIDICVEINFGVKLQLFANNNQNNNYRLSVYLFQNKGIKIHLIILSLLSNIGIIGCNITSICYLRYSALHNNIHIFSIIARFIFGIKLLSGVGQHIQEYFVFNQDELQIYCNQSIAVQSNGACNLILGEKVLIAFIYISSFCIGASQIMFRYCYRLYINNQSLLHSRFINDSSQQQNNDICLKQHQTNNLELAAAQVQLELQQNCQIGRQEEAKKIDELKLKINLDQLYLSNQTIGNEGFDQAHEQETKPSSNQPKQQALQRLSSIKKGELYGNPYLDESPTLKKYRMNTYLDESPTSKKNTHYNFDNSPTNKQNKSKQSSSRNIPINPYLDESPTFKKRNNNIQMDESPTLKRRNEYPQVNEQPILNAPDQQINPSPFINTIFINGAKNKFLKALQKPPQFSIQLQKAKDSNQLDNSEINNQDVKQQPSQQGQNQFQNGRAYKKKELSVITMAPHFATNLTNSIIKSAFQGNIGEKISNGIKVATSPTKATMSKVLSFFLDKH